MATVCQVWEEGRQNWICHEQGKRKLRDVERESSPWGHLAPPQVMACLWLANYVSKLGKTPYLMPLSLRIDKLYWVARNLRMKSHSAHCPLLRKALILLSSGLIQTSEQLIQIGHMWFHVIALKSVTGKALLLPVGENGRVEPIAVVIGGAGGQAERPIVSHHPGCGSNAATYSDLGGFA